MDKPITIERGYEQVFYIEVGDVQYPLNDYNKGALEMLQMISKDKGWGDTETAYGQQFFNNN